MPDYPQIKMKAIDLNNLELYTPKIPIKTIGSLLVSKRRPGLLRKTLYRLLYVKLISVLGQYI